MSSSCSSSSTRSWAPTTFELEYDENTRTAAETFRLRLGNCLSFTTLFVTLARGAGLKADFQEVDIPPDWSTRKDIFVLNQHVNVSDLPRRRRESRSSISTSATSKTTYKLNEITDKRAIAHFFNNIGVERMQDGETVEAVAYFRQAIIESDGKFAPPWTNLGTLYRRCRHFAHAEAAYLEALRVDKRDAVAMSNLVSLYETMDDPEKAEIYQKKVDEHRMQNPLPPVQPRRGGLRKRRLRHRHRTPQTRHQAGQERGQVLLPSRSELPHERRRESGPSVGGQGRKAGRDRRREALLLDRIRQRARCVEKGTRTVEIHLSDHEELSPRHRRASHSRPPGSAQNLGTCGPCGRRDHRPRRRSQRPTRAATNERTSAVALATARLAGRPGRHRPSRHRRRRRPAGQSRHAPCGRSAGSTRFIGDGDRVAIKPNCAWDRSAEQAANTDPELIGELVRLCLAAGAASVVVLDNTCHDPARAFARSGIAEATRTAGGTVAHQNSTGTVNLDLGGAVLGEWEVLQPIVEADRLINVPVVKHHSLGRGTLGMKNWMGAIVGSRPGLHQRLDQACAELGAAFRPTLTVIDATRVLTGGGPTGGSLDLVRDGRSRSPSPPTRSRPTPGARPSSISDPPNSPTSPSPSGSVSAPPTGSRWRPRSDR